jgi:hypothetical protein
MSLDSIVGKQVYFNLRTKKLVAVLDRNPQEATIATVGDVSLGRRRSVRASLLHSDYLASDGQPHGNGYVPVDALPQEHPNAAKAADTRSNVNIDALDDMTDEELADVILEQQEIASDAKDTVDRAKAVAKSRRGDKRGTEVHGDIAFVYSGGSKFDADTAQKNLPAEDFKRISVLKPDAALARALFKKDPKKLALCLKDNGPSLTVRRATDDDREEADNLTGDDNEDFTVVAPY